jgi:hypothetical protein
VTLFGGLSVPSLRRPKPAQQKPVELQPRGSRRENFRIVVAHAARLQDENITIKHENTALKRQLGTVTEERDALQHEKDEHQEEFPNGCVDAKSIPEGGNTYCPGTGTTDHSVHGVFCYGRPYGDK